MIAMHSKALALFNSQFARFVVVGGLNTAATFLLFLGLCHLFSTSVSYTIAYVAGIVLSYLLNARVVFRSSLSVSTAIQFPLTYAVQYVYGLAVITMLTSWLFIPKAVAMAVLVATNVPITFFLTKYVLNKKQQT